MVLKGIEQIHCSIDRLTVLARHDLYPGLYLGQKLKKYLEGEFENNHVIEIIDYQQTGAYGIEWHRLNEFDEDKAENVVFIHDFVHGEEHDLRLDFNPNTLKKYDIEYVWTKIRYFLNMLQCDLRLSRFDLAFDLYDVPEIQHMRNLRGGITRKMFYGRSGALETIYWGSQASDVQIRLYDKIVEIGASESDLELFEMPCTDLWRLEMQMRTKVIDENLVNQVVSRLDDFSFFSAWAFDLKPEMAIFADMLVNRPEDIELAYKHIPDRTVRSWKSKVRKVIKEQQNDYVLAIKKALQRDSEKLRSELKRYVQVYLGF